jgi:hypothetical protein
MKKSIQVLVLLFSFAMSLTIQANAGHASNQAQ